MLDRSISPKITSFTDLKFDYPGFVTLSNGVKLYVLNSGDQDVNKFEVIFRGGLLEETKPLQSFVLASMLIHGSAEYTSQDVAEILDYNGSQFSATNHDNFTHISLNSLNKNFDTVLPVLKSILYGPSIPEREYNLLGSQIKSAYQTARQRVKYLSQMAGRKLYFGEKHPFSHMICDEDVDNLAIEDILSFHHKYYKPENCVMVLSGKVDEKEIALIDKYFGQAPNLSDISEFVECERISSATKSVVVDKEGALQSSVYMLQEAIPRNHPDYIKLRILITALGGYFGSRLMQNIREDKGYTYGINAMLVGRRSGAKIVITSECDTAYTYLLVREVENEIRRIQDKLMSEEELDTVKNNMLSDLAKTLDSPFSMASCVSSNIIFSTGEDYFNRQIAEITKITTKELQEVANKYLDVSKFYTAIAGDEKQLKLYGK